MRLPAIVALLSITLGCTKPGDEETRRQEAKRIKLEGLIQSLGERGYPKLARAAKEFIAFCEVKAAGQAMLSADDAAGGYELNHDTISEALVVIVPEGQRGDEAGCYAASLGHERWDVRELASRALHRLGPRAILALDPLVERLRAEEKPWIRKRLAETLGALDGASVYALKDMLGEDDEDIRALAAYALVRMDKDASRPAITVAVKALDSPSHRVQALAAAFLTRHGEELEKGVPLLMRALGSSDRDLRRIAYAQIGLGGVHATSAIPSLIQGFSDPDPAVRYGAALSVISLGNTAMPPLVKAAKSEDPHIRFWAAVSLGHLGGGRQREVVPVLSELLSDPDRTVVEEARAAWLHALYAGDEALTALKEELLGTRAVAARGLGLIGPPASYTQSRLARLLREKHVQTRMAAAVALGQLCDGAADVISALRTTALGDTDLSIRQAATIALREIRSR